VIIAVGSDKGAPGATTLATVLGLVWPGERVVVELDPRGADLPFRLMQASGQPMATAPSIVGLAIDTRAGSTPPPMDRYAQHTALGVPVIPGELSSRANSKMAAHLPAIAATAARWPGAVVADLGSLQSTNPAMVVAKAAATVLLLTRPTLEGLGHLRDRVEELTEFVGDPRRDRTTVGVVLVTDSHAEKSAIDQTAKLLSSIGSPAPVVGVFTHDPAGAAALWSGPVSKKLAKSALLRSGHHLVLRLRSLWPELTAEPESLVAPVAEPRAFGGPNPPGVLR
jgi:hypothetical protein